ncbi:hypothetical protein ES332_D04G101100v1 [Gossypium tomentosum]|uniref:Uncharacterized protein n=2 Tax=Gossypium TaxID=3633 RepID=A0A5D2LEV3_GOSTO|nr:hypothetical protein ES332_D04G101100v1 [Gossypium tomentosum]
MARDPKSRGKQPRSYAKVPKQSLSGKGSDRAMTTRRWAWKQPSFEESLLFQVSVAGRSVNRGRFLVTTPGDIRSENADMSNEKSCEKHDRLPVEGFLRSVNLRRVNRSLRNPRKGCRPMGTRK